MTATPADAPVADWVTPELITTDPRHVADELRRTAPVAAVPFTGGLMLSSFGLIKEFLGDYTRYTARARAYSPAPADHAEPATARRRASLGQDVRSQRSEAN